MDFCLKYGFLPNYGKSRVFTLGIDARYTIPDVSMSLTDWMARSSVILDGYSAATFTHGRFQHHASVNCSLTQLFTFLCQLSNAPAHCIFVFDGNDRPAIKRGINVVLNEPLLYQNAREVIEAFGFQCHDVRIPFYCCSMKLNALRQRVTEKQSLLS